MDAVDSIRRWGEERDWRGYDPYDALNSPFVPYLTLGTAFGRRALTQVVKRSPVNLRPLLRIPPAHNDKALGLVASGYARLAVARADDTAADAARRWLDRVVSDAVVDGTGRAWGYHFDVRTRFFGYARGTPNTIATSFVAHALLDGLELLGETRFGDAAREAAGFLVDAHARQRRGQSRSSATCREERELVHNANLLACSVVVRTAALRDEPLDERVAAAVATSVEAQRADGSWAVLGGAGGRLGRQLPHRIRARVARALRGTRRRPAIRRSSAASSYWERELFLPTASPSPPRGAASRSTRTTTPRRSRPGSPPWTGVTRRSTAQNALPTSWWHECSTRDGHVDFQRGRFVTNRVPFVRWTTAPAFRALAGLELARSRR